jgi:hypothetical protein
MQLMAILRRRTELFSPEQFAELLDAEADGVRRLYGSSIVHAIWSRGDVLGAIMLLECADVPSAERAIASLPLVSRNMVDVQIVELRPYRGFLPAD